MEQNVHGPRPSFTQMILPQERQFGAAARSGWRVALQVQRREAGEAFLARGGLVWISRVRMAESWAEIRHWQRARGTPAGEDVDLQDLEE